MSIRGELANSNPYLKMKYESKQYTYAKRLIEMKLRHKLNQDEMANLGGIDFDKYVDMEGSDLSIAEPEYEKLIYIIEGKLYGLKCLYE